MRKGDLSCSVHLPLVGAAEGLGVGMRVGAAEGIAVGDRVGATIANVKFREILAQKMKNKGTKTCNEIMF